MLSTVAENERTFLLLCAKADIHFAVRLVYHTVCPRSSDPPEKIFQYICIRKLGLHRFLIITIF